MRRMLTSFAPALLLCLVALAAPAPPARTAEAAAAPPDRCEECMVGVQARYDQCLAQFDQFTDPRAQRCHDQYNEGVVQCFRNFCEQ